MSTNMLTFKICLTGASTTDTPVGKTTWVNHLVKNKSVKKSYNPTFGVEIHPIILKVISGDLIGDIIRLNIWDCAGRDKFAGCGDRYYVKADGCIVGCQPNSYCDNIRDNTLDFQRVEDGPVVKVMFMEDMANYKRLDHRRQFSRVDCSVSTLAMINILEPINLLLRKIVGDTDMEVVLAREPNVQCRL